MKPSGIRDKKHLPDVKQEHIRVESTAQENGSERMGEKPGVPTPSAHTKPQSGSYEDLKAKRRNRGK